MGKIKFLLSVFLIIICFNIVYASNWVPGNIIVTLYDEIEDKVISDFTSSYRQYELDLKRVLSKNIVWNGQDEDGTHVSSGIYLYHIKSDNQTLTQKMLLLK